MNINQLLKKGLTLLDQNSPLILTGVGVAGVVSTAVLAARATPAYLDDLHRYENRGALWIKSTPWEKVKIGFRPYLPALLTGSAAITAIIGAQSINSRRQAALVSGFTLVETAFKEYREKAIELDPKQDVKIRDAVAKDRVAATYDENTQVLVLGGSVLFRDEFSGRYFQSDVETLRKAMNDINQQCFNDMYASQNEFYSLIGLPHIPSAEVVGWSNDNAMELYFSAVKTEDDRACLEMSYRIQPTVNFNKLW